MRKNGESNPATYLLGVVVAAGLFYAFHVAPLYLDNLEAKEAAAEAFSIWIIKDEKTARDNMLFRLNHRTPSTSHYEVDADGVESIKPGFGLSEKNVTFDYDEKLKRLTVRIEYDRIVEFAPLKKRKSYHLSAEKSGIVTK